MLRVILIDNRDTSAHALSALLSAQGHSVVGILQSAAVLQARVPDLKPDVILAGMQTSDGDTIADIRQFLREHPHPVAIYDGIKDDAMIASVIDAGVSVYVTDDIRSRDLTALLRLTIARFNKFLAMQNALQSAQDRLEERKNVERAKSLLIKHHALDEDGAHHTLQQLAMNQRISLRAAATNVIAMFELLPEDKP